MSASHSNDTTNLPSDLSYAGTSDQSTSPMNVQPLDQLGHIEALLAQRLQVLEEKHTNQMLQLQGELAIARNKLATMQNNWPTFPNAQEIASAVGSRATSKSKNSAPEKPATFDGSSSKVEPLLSAARRYLTVQSQDFQDEKTKLLWALSFFKEGIAESWARHITDALLSPDIEDPFTSYQSFEAAVRQSSSSVSRVEQAANSVIAMPMNKSEGLGAFVNRFRPEAEICGLGDASLILHFRKAIEFNNQKEIASLSGGKFPTQISNWYQCAQTIDQIRTSAAMTSNMINIFPQSRPSTRPQRSTTQTVNLPALPTANDTMDVDGHRKFKGKCYNCQAEGHLARNCPQPHKSPSRSIRNTSLDEIIQAVRSALDSPLAPVNVDNGQEKEDFPISQQ